VHIVSSKWMWLVLPVNLALGPLGTLVTLEIISRGGNSLEVGLVMTLGNLVQIPAAMIWGLMSDRFDRKWVALTSFGLTGTLMTLFPYARGLSALAALYPAVIFFSVGYGTPFNLLIMETCEKRKWAGEFSRMSMLAALGVVVGLVISSAAVLFVKVDVLLQILSASMLASFTAGVRLIPRSRIHLERVAIVHFKESFITRLKILPLFFLHPPDPHHFKMFRLSRLTRKPVNFVPLLYIGISLFYLSASIFYTVYPVALEERGLNDSEVLGVIALATGIQALIYMKTGDLVDRLTEQKTAVLSLSLRGVSQILMALIINWLTGFPVLVLNLLLNSLASGIGFPLFNTASNTLIFKVVGERSHGRGLGVYSTLTGVALFTGSLASGYLAHFTGYLTTFSIAGLLLLASSAIFRYLEEG